MTLTVIEECKKSFIRLVQNEPTAYDCEHGCLMKGILEIVKEGETNGTCC